MWCYAPPPVVAALGRAGPLLWMPMDQQHEHLESAASSCVVGARATRPYVSRLGVASRRRSSLAWTLGEVMAQGSWTMLVWGRRRAEAGTGGGEDGRMDKELLGWRSFLADWWWRMAACGQA
jgi:hypothetical protein